MLYLQTKYRIKKWKNGNVASVLFYKRTLQRYL